jgi:ribonuclease VapC
MIILETSALVALIRGESDLNRVTGVLKSAHSVVISAFSLYEAGVVLRGKGDIDDPKAAIHEVLSWCGAKIVAFDEVQADLAYAAYAKFGKGSGSPAKLNLADCEAYALATHLDAPLLFTGQDFAHTDVVCA